MLNYIIRRLLLIIPTVLGITMVVFAGMALSPGGVSASLIDQEGSMRAEDREAMRAYLEKRYGLDKPLPVQYLRWLNRVSPIGVWDKPTGGRGFGFKRPDLGYSFLRERPVGALLAETLPITVLLNLLVIPIIYSISITTGILAGRNRGKALDTGTGVLFLALWSIPVMWAGVMLIGFLANKRYVQWFPTSGLHDDYAAKMSFFPRWGGAGGFSRGWLLDSLWHLAGPMICLTYGGFAYLSKLMRASVLENLSSDFVRTARAKGVSEKTVLFRHVLRNSVLPLITVAAGILPALLGGSLLVEYIFGINGMGRLMVESAFRKDREMILSMTLISALIGLVSLLVADVCYAVADPRVTYE